MNRFHVGVLSAIINICWLTRTLAVQCTTDDDCISGIGPASFCRIGRGTCSNPFESGCLYRKLPGWDKKRVCNSEDPPDAVERGLCRKSLFDYMELRIFSENWESVFFEAWILQVILSEMLDVPSTIETGSYDAQLNLYHPDSPFDYGPSNTYEVLRNGNRIGDCRLARKGAEDYQPCAHFVPESWDMSTFSVHTQDLVEGETEPLQNMGVLGQQGWFVTKFTVEADPSLGNYLGLMGQNEKLADTFLRPTTWKDYCNEVSPNGCSNSDETAQRPPLTEEEEDRMFMEGVYRGFFRKTEENNCTISEENCTGHITDYPCAWGSFLEAQAHHLNIPLRSSGNQGESRGYSFQQMKEIWRAANATKSNCIMYWWFPEALYHEFAGSDAEFFKVTLPPATRECFLAKKRPEDRCVATEEERLGVPDGACENKPDLLEKAIVRSLYDLTHTNSFGQNDAFTSPGYEVLKSFSIDNFQLSDIFNYWEAKASPREAICQWIVENMDYMERFVPPSYPRAIERKDERRNWLLYASLGLGSLASVLVALTTFVIWKKRHQRAVMVAQVEFLLLVLSGAGILAVGSIVVGSLPSDNSCVAAWWLVLVGYTLELIPLIVKMTAIHRVVSAAKRLRRIVLKRESLLGAVGAVCALVLVYLAVWTIVDPPRRMEERFLADRQNSDGYVIVETSYFCRSGNLTWPYIATAWVMALLLWASLIAFQARKLDKDFNESRTLAFMIYSHFVFVILVVVTFGVSGEVSETTLRRMRSLIFSVDTISALFIYFLPILTDNGSSRRVGREISGLQHETFGRSSPLERLRGFLASGLSMISAVEEDDVIETAGSERMEEQDHSTPQLEHAAER